MQGFLPSAKSPEQKALIVAVFLPSPALQTSPAADTRVYFGRTWGAMSLIRSGRRTIQQIVAGSSARSSDMAVHPLHHTCQGLRFRKLEVILTTNIDKLGKAGETVKVAPGYFRNHLMPKLLAVPNIEKFAYLIREQRKIYQPKDEEDGYAKVVTEATGDNTFREYEKAAKRLDKARLVLRRLINVEKLRQRATKDEPIELQKPVTKEDIVSEVARQLCVQMEPVNVHLPSPLTKVGEYEVPLLLPRSIPLPEGKFQWTLKVKVRCK